ncbi:MAG: DUF131 domain-containing protein [Candidatus Aenigmarchaeota archaeon]|nr:DUF131 domain-containing protein [Candidatus Aenigmarchaeota archaeon]
MSDFLVPAGITVVLLGIMLIVIGTLASGQKSESNVHFGVGGFIGPIPFGFANSREMLYVTIAVSAIFFAAFLMMNLKHIVR